MKVHDETMYWESNKKWYKSNYEEECYELTPDAPPRAVESFRLYLLKNDLPLEDWVIPGKISSEYE